MSGVNFDLLKLYRRTDVAKAIGFPYWGPDGTGSGRLDQTHRNGLGGRSFVKIRDYWGNIHVFIFITDTVAAAYNYDDIVEVDAFKIVWCKNKTFQQEQILHTQAHLFWRRKVSTLYTYYGKSQMIDESHCTDSHVTFLLKEAEEYLHNLAGGI